MTCDEDESKTDDGESKQAEQEATLTSKLYPIDEPGRPFGHVPEDPRSPTNSRVPGAPRSGTYVLSEENDPR